MSDTPKPDAGNCQDYDAIKLREDLDTALGFLDAVQTECRLMNGKLTEAFDKLNREWWAGFRAGAYLGILLGAVAVLWSAYA
jgi:hypothetical protein